MTTVISLLTENGIAGSYWTGLPENGSGSGNWRDRYNDGYGGYRVYGSMHAWWTDRMDNTASGNSEILEIQGAWTDTDESGFYGVRIQCYDVLITTKINGVRADSFHNGVIGAGYIKQGNNLYNPTFYTLSPRVVLDGIELRQVRSGGRAIRMGNGSYQGFITNCIVSGSVGYYDTTATGNSIANCLIHGCDDTGITITNGAGAFGTVAYNTVVTCAKGISVDYRFMARIIGNVSFGNTQNYEMLDGADIYHASKIYVEYNAGEAGDIPFALPGAVSYTDLTTADFTDFGNGDFRPSSPSSKLVNRGILLPGVPTIDIVDYQRPSYSTTLGRENPDLGCFEYDYNEIPAVTYNFTLSGIPTASEIRIYKKDNTPGIIGTVELSGVESWTGGDYMYTYEHTVNKSIVVQVMHPEYEESTTFYTLTSNDQTIPITLSKEENI